MFFLVILMSSLASTCHGQEEIKARPGEDVTLHCHSLKDAAITLLEWSRPDLKSEGYVFFYRNSRSYESYQHQSFLGRVVLRNASSLQDGDVSVILRNVNINDTGTYECRIINSIKDGSNIELKHHMNLKVTDSGDTAGNTWNGGNEDSEKKNQITVIIGVSVAAVFLIVGIVFLGVYIYRKSKNCENKKSKSGRHLVDQQKSGQQVV